MRVLLALAMMSTSVIADELPRGLGHPHGGEHWYDNACCNMQDCERVEEGAIVRSATGYVVRYQTSRGFEAGGFLRFGDKGIRFSKDGEEHACATRQRVLCIYIPWES